MKLVIANWKSTKNWNEVKEWWDIFSHASFSDPDLQVVLCPAFVHLLPLSELIASANFPFPLSLGVQDVSPFPDGTYTGAVTARMLEGVATHAIIGHSERRTWFRETPQDVALKVDQLLLHHITPVVSVDRDTFRQQLSQFNNDHLLHLCVMYEPPEAISIQSGPVGVGTPAQLSDIESMVETLSNIAPDTPVLYGGSVKSANAHEFLTHPKLAGVVVGTASMEVHEFITLLNHG